MSNHSVLGRIKTASNVWICFLVFLAGSVLQTWMCSLEDRAGLGVAFSFGAFAFIGWCFIIPMLCRDVHLQWLAGENWIQHIKSTFITQDVVDLHLHQLAEEFSDLCEKKIRLQNAESAQCELKEFSDELANAESALWSAHQLAMCLGLTTKKNIFDYLKTTPS